MNDRRDRDRDRDRDRKRNRDDRDLDRDRDRDRIRRSRSRTPDRTRSRHTRSRTRSPDERDRHRHRHRHHRSRSRSPTTPPRKRHKDDVVPKDKDDAVSKDKKQKENAIASNDEGNKDGDLMDEDEMEMMKKFGIPVGFDSTKGRPVAGNDVGAVRKVTKRQPRQYMNRRGGFNRPLPAECNR
ncbi:U4/U6.U5 small nuclear ribonucleoprotein [Perilla frutescens var. hirtella]|nr:U4/U6.U5 small nuclear ribonucleoprotein [Perilla frutescens var. hirtella]